MINVAHDTNIIRGMPVCVDLSRIGGGFVNEHEEHEEEITRETLKNKSNHASTILTSTQDPQGYKNNKGKDDTW